MHALYNMSKVASMTYMEVKLAAQYWSCVWHSYRVEQSCLKNAQSSSLHKKQIAPTLG